MNPIIIYRVIAGVGTLIGAAGAAYGYDQHNKREKEAEIFDAEIDDLTQKNNRFEIEMTEKDEMLLKSRRQVRTLAHELEKLKKDASELSE